MYIYICPGNGGYRSTRSSSSGGYTAATLALEYLPEKTKKKVVYLYKIRDAVRVVPEICRRVRNDFLFIYTQTHMYSYIYIDMLKYRT